MKQWIRSFWPVLLIVLLELVIFITNYTPGTYLMGWDNVMPEFDFKTNIMRNLVGVWQEYRGLGLYDGMSHVASTLHTVVLWMMSAVLPQNLLRYSFIFLMHFLGGLGMYKLLKELRVLKQEKDNKILSFVGAVFYLLNPITIQMFYTPLESFAIHFASIPWIVLTLTRFLRTGTKRSYIALCLAFLLSTAQFFIPTLFVPISLIVILCSIVPLVHWKRVLLVLGAFFCINAFWLLPIAYGAKQTMTVVPQAKINQMSSGKAFLQNMAFGDIVNVLSMKGYPINFNDITPLMDTWKTHWNTPLSIICIIVCIAISFIGLPRTPFPILVLWIISFFMLANNTPGIRELTIMVRSKLPVFAELFRFPFTKFATLFSFTYGIALVLGISRIIDVYRKNALIRITTLSIILCVLGYLAYPVVYGNFFYSKLRVILPIEYQHLFTYMQNQPYGRVALLPQPEYWSWKYYNFGYRGSGFIWYGIPQPTLDRAFDPWSNNNEAYYWELSNALYSKDARAFTLVLKKYAISYLIIDENQMSVSHPRALFIDETKQMFDQIPTIQKQAIFGYLTVYSFLDAPPQVTAMTNVPRVQTNNKFIDTDVIYERMGTYASPYNDHVDSFYPFQSLFTKRSIVERPFIIEDSQQQFKLFDQYKQTSFTISKQESFAEEATPSGTTTLSFDSLWHKQGYLVEVVSRHTSGQPMMITFINKTARHTELETLLPTSIDWQTTYFILPPLSLDGKGYDVYLSNKKIAGTTTMNDIASIRFYTLPYTEIVHTATVYQQLPAEQMVVPKRIVHPNPAYYIVTLTPAPINTTLILNQSYDPGWHAYVFNNPIIQLKQHVLVNNWANGWLLPEAGMSNKQIIVIFFVPQLLQWFGFLLIPVPFLLMIRKTL